MTPERLARIRVFLRGEWLFQDGESALVYARELLAALDERGEMVDRLAFKIDELVRERDAAIRAVRDMTQAVADRDAEISRLKRENEMLEQQRAM